MARPAKMDVMGAMARQAKMELMGAAALHWRWMSCWYESRLEE
jgi:hypothetical protein